jgi:TPR repeat protein
MDKLDIDELARRYRDGIGKPQDWKLAFKHFELARAAGLTYAIPDVAWCHFWGLGTIKDPAQSAAVWQDALRAYPTWASPKTGLAAQHALGCGIARDVARCLQLLDEADSPFAADDSLRATWLSAWSGDVLSQFEMARWSAERSSQNVWDYREQVRWLRLAADAGLADAQYELSVYFETKGRGNAVELDRNVASHWKWKAALQKHARALEELRDAGDGLMGAFANDE